MSTPKLSQIPPLERYAALSALVVSIVLTGVKFGAFALTASAAVFSDALESIVNVAASSFALYALALSHEPADESHPYGHGKVEFLSATFEGGMIFAAGAVVIWRSVAEFFVGTGVTQLGWGFGLVSLASVVNGVVGGILLRIGRQRKSMALEADGKHLISDVVTSGGVLLCLALVWWTGKTWIDPLGAVVIGCYLFYTSYTLLRHSIGGLMDEQDQGDNRLIRSLLDAHITGEKEPKICAYHKLRHRHHGRMHWIDFHIWVPPGMSVYEAHKVAGIIEREIELALGEADATSHIEPCPGCETCEDEV